MVRWDATLNWGPDDGIKDDDDEGIAAAIAAAIRDLAEQRPAWLDLVHVIHWPAEPTPPRPMQLPADP